MAAGAGDNVVPASDVPDALLAHGDASIHPKDSRAFGHGKVHPPSLGGCPEHIHLLPRTDLKIVPPQINYVIATDRSAKTKVVVEHYKVGCVL